MDATCKIQDNIHVFSLAHKYVSRILGTYQLVCSEKQFYAVKCYLMTSMRTISLIKVLFSRWYLLIP
ncbi:hypothetical protein HMPREF9943_00294 [Eggerthia catenaformis OT 569 = DSM 20559]|uniref:Uncharacterized protein n=1 Tax=Eggerthia catenaformis OT 569 = DSM 20559 TaxID=999415 RepID=M2PAZ3_9FIRM|nr:hypothetical protein HMPREF9943_00294 [Eggerthia catenaformis OT 569 = DSM 20559]